MKQFVAAVSLILAFLVLTPVFSVYPQCDPVPVIVDGLPRMGAGWSGAVAIVGNLLYEVSDAVNYANIYDINTGTQVGNIYFGSWCANDIKGFTYDPFRGTFWAKVGAYAYEVPLTGGQYISRIPINTGGLVFGIWKDPDEEHVMWVADPAQPEIRKVDMRNSSVLAWIHTTFHVRGVARVGDTLWAVRAGEPGQTGVVFQLDMQGNELCKYLLPAAKYDHDAGGCDIDSEGYLWIEGGKGTMIYRIDIGHTPPAPAVIPIIDSGDYNGDSTSDIAVFRSGTGLWAIRGLTRVYFGRDGDIPASGDYNGDGTSDLALFRPGTGLWAVRGVTRTFFGTSGDIPVPGDYNGDGKTTAAIFRPSNGLWTGQGLPRTYFGGQDDIPSPFYLNQGPGRVKQLAIFRPSSGLWAVKGLTRMYFGAEGDYPVPGSYTPGAYNLTAAIYRPDSGLWAIRGVTRVYFGQEGDQPVLAHYTGYLPDNISIFRAETGLWSVRGVTRAYFGTYGDIAVTGLAVNPSTAAVW